jgi:hypothetical protein
MCGLPVRFSGIVFQKFAAVEMRPQLHSDQRCREATAAAKPWRRSDLNSPRSVVASSEYRRGRPGGFTIGKSAMLHHPIGLRFVIVVNCPSPAVPIPVFVGAVLRRALELGFADVYLIPLQPGIVGQQRPGQRVMMMRLPMLLSLCGAASADRLRYSLHRSRDGSPLAPGR